MVEHKRQGLESRGGERGGGSAALAATTFKLLCFSECIYISWANLGSKLTICIEAENTIQSQPYTFEPSLHEENLPALIFNCYRPQHFRKCYGGRRGTSDIHGKIGIIGGITSRLCTALRDSITFPVAVSSAHLWTHPSLCAH